MIRTASVMIGLGGLSFAVTVQAADYRLSQEPDRSRSLRVTVERAAPAREDRLVLRGAGFGVGVRPQVEGVSCDGAPLGADASDAGNAAGGGGAGTATTWLVPRGCRQISWSIPLDLPGGADASAQRSLRSADGSFTFVSEASSLPRLANPSGPEFLVVPASASGVTVPGAVPDRRLLLPSSSEPPLFVVLASKPAAESASGRVRVTYFLDDPTQLAHLPPIDSVMSGLQWLAGLVPESDRTSFMYAWLGVASGGRAPGGAAGRDVLAVNYVRDGKGDAMRSGLMAAMPFIEACHQLAGSLGDRPGWAEESLATYFGVRALEQSRSGDDTAAKLLRRFESESDKFPVGLIEVHRRVSAGDRSMYGAYFTKGVALWSAVDAALRAAGHSGGLPSRLEQVWTAKYDKEGRPTSDFAARLALPAADWDKLSARFLGPG
jgi:hypothetical protein